MKEINKRSIVRIVLSFLVMIASYYMSFGQNYVDPFIQSIGLVNTVDADNDGYYEQWSFKVDVDAYYQDDIADDVLIYIEEANLLPGGDSYGPYTFTGYNEADAVTIGPFTSEGIDGLPANLDFTINAGNYYGTWYSSKTVPADNYNISVAPLIVSVDIVNTVNTDGDNWLESFYFEIDIDPDNGPRANDVEVIIKVDGSFFDNTPRFDFIGITSDDKILVGPVSSSSFSNLPRVIGFELIASNDEGNDTHIEYVNIDGEDNGVVIKSIYTQNTVDYDNDNFFEEWYLQVDLDNKQDVQLEEVQLVVFQNGIERYSSPLFAVDGISQLDYQVLGPFTYTDYSGGTSNLVFTVEAKHAFGNAEQDIIIPVDGEKGPRYVDPFIRSIEIVNTTDADNDGYFEQWSFQIDVDAYYQDDVADNVYIYIEEPNFYPTGNNYGPYSFNGYNEDDAVTIGPFNTEGIDGLPDNLEFTINASNSYGTSYSSKTVPTDDYNASSAPIITSVDQTGGQDVDQDTWLESFFLEIDVNPADGTNSTDVYITVQAEGLAYLQTFGPYNFSGNSSSDAVSIGPIQSSPFSNLPRIINFQITAYNNNGNDQETEPVKIDGNDNGVVIKTIDVVEYTDEDNDNYYEEWYFEVDVDNKTNIQLEEVTVVVYFSGSEKDRSQQYAVLGISTQDKVKIGPFYYFDYASNTSNINFYIEAENQFGVEGKTVQVPVDGELGPDYTEPFINSIELVNTTDINNNGIFEQWSFKIDVDAIYQDDIADDVYIYIEESRILPSGKDYGPYTFTGYNEGDAVIIGPFNTEGIEGLPANLNFTINAGNGYGTSYNSKIVPADVITGEVPIASFTADFTSGAAPLTVNYTDLSLNEPTSWNWELTGATPAVSNQQNPQVTYSSPGIYPVKLTAANEYGSNSATIAGFITVTSKILSNDATLSSLTLSNDQLQQEFSPARFIYSVMLTPPDNQLPVITAVPNSDKAFVNIVYPVNIYSTTASERTAYITVTAENQQSQNVYQIEFSIEGDQEPGIKTLLFTVHPKSFKFEVNAGNDVSVKAGEEIKLGSSLSLNGGSAPYTYFWYDNNQQLLPGSMPIINPDSDQSIRVMVIDSKGCIANDTIQVLVEETNTLNRLLAEENIQVYPNPATSRITIDFKTQVDETVHIYLLDATSRIVLTSSDIPGNGKMEITLNDLAAGVYLLKIQNRDLHISRQIIIKRK